MYPLKKLLLRRHSLLNYSAHSNSQSASQRSTKTTFGCVTTRFQRFDANIASRQIFTKPKEYVIQTKLAIERKKGGRSDWFVAGPDAV